MTVRIDGLPPCIACGGKRLPLVSCDSCGAAKILRDVASLEWTVPCPECGTPNPWQLICDQCHARSPVPGMPADLPPKPLATEAPASVAVPAGRSKRRIKGDVDSDAVTDLLRVLGLDASRAQALIDRGYDAPWKIARAKEDQLARIPEVGPIAARKMVASFHLLNYAPPKQTKESIAQGEYECPLCGCVTSAFSPSCVECGAMFEEEEMEEDLRHAFAVEGDSGLLAFYDGRLTEKPDEPELLYARGLLLESLGHTDEALAAFDRAIPKASDSKKIKVAQLRLQAKHLRKPEVSAKLRSTAASLLDDVAWEEEVAQLDRMISAAERECPHCGASVPAEMAMCPTCGTRLAVSRPPPPKKPEPSPTPELDALVDDLLVGELEESLSEDELERTKAAVLDWLIQELEESMAPEAQVALAAEEREGEAAEAKPIPPVPSPLSDSIGFLSQWVRGGRGLVSGLRPKRAPRGSGRVNGIVNGKGRVNGLVNGVGRTNGLVNGIGRVNGLTTPAGRVNGLVTTRGRVNGLVTGQGRVNGIATGTPFGRSSIRGLRLPYPSRRIRYLSVASGILVAILIAGLLFVPVSGPSTPIVIDGSFNDWSSVPMFDAATTASDANVSIARYASLLDRDSLYLFVSTSGGMFGDATGYDGVDFLIDADGNASTGFSFGGIGADAVVEVFGGNHTVEGARLYSFPVDSEVNWSRRQPGASVQAAASAGGLEIRASTYDIDRFNPSRFLVSVYADDFLGASSRSLALLSPAEGAILLEARPLTSVVGSGITPLLEIRARALGLPQSVTWQVSSFQFTATPGVIPSLSAESINLTQGRPEDTISVSVSTPGFFPGDVVDVSLVGANSSVPVFVHGVPVRAYVTAPPARIKIDGLFSDWVSRDMSDMDSKPVSNPDLDIMRYGAATSNGTAFFHVHVGGTLLGGGIPERLFKSPESVGNRSSGGGMTVLPRRTGEDLLLVYLDSDAYDSIGLAVGGILADRLVEIRGQGGKIRSESVYSWANRWMVQPGVLVSAEKNRTDIEASLPLPALNGTRMIIETTDWAADGDMTIPLTAPSFVSPFPPDVSSLGLVAPAPLGFGGSIYYLRDGGSLGSAIDCSSVKLLSLARGGPGATVPLVDGSKICFFTDPALTDETVGAGTWSASLDLDATGTVLDVSFAITDQDGLFLSPFCSLTKTTTAGLNEIFTCDGPERIVSMNQRIRLRIEYISGSSTNLAYDGNISSQDSSMTVPIPEFENAVASAISVGVFVLFVSFRRRRRQDLD